MLDIAVVGLNLTTQLSVVCVVSIILYNYLTISHRIMWETITHSCSKQPPRRQVPQIFTYACMIDSDSLLYRF